MIVDVPAYLKLPLSDRKTVDAWLESFRRDDWPIAVTRIEVHENLDVTITALAREVNGKAYAIDMEPVTTTATFKAGEYPELPSVL